MERKVIIVLKAESFEYRMELEAEMEMLHLKSELRKKLKKDFNKKIFSFRYMNKPLFENKDENEIIGNVFYDKENIIHATTINENFKSFQLGSECNTSFTLGTSDVHAMLRFITELENRPHFKFFNDTNSFFLGNFESKLEQFKFNVNKLICELIKDILVNFQSDMKINEFKIFKIKCEEVKKNVECINKESLSFTKFQEMYGQCIKILNEISAEEEVFKERYTYITGKCFFFEKTIQFLHKYISSYIDSIDKDIGLPFSTSGNFNFFTEFDIPTHYINTPTINQNSFTILNNEAVTYSKTIHSNFFSEKLTTILKLKYDRLKIINNAFESFNSSLKDCHKAIVDEIDFEDTGEYLQEMNAKIENLHSILSSKVSFSTLIEETEPNSKLLELLNAIKHEDEKLEWTIKNIQSETEMIETKLHGLQNMFNISSLMNQMPKVNDNKKMKRIVDTLISIHRQQSEVNISNELFTKNIIPAGFSTLELQTKSWGNYNDLICSAIVKPEEIDVISQWINTHRSIVYKLAYRASVHGGKAINFHWSCDHLSPTIVFIATSTGNRFGGFTSLAWDKNINGHKHYDETAFVFSLDKKKKLKCPCNRSVIYCDPSSGASFGKFDIFVSDDCLNNCQSSSKLNCYGTQEDHKEGRLLADDEYFQVKELEVYQVICYSDINCIFSNTSETHR